MTERTLEAKQATGFWTIDEQRAHTAKPPLDGEGDVLSKPAPVSSPNGARCDEELDGDGKPKTKSAFASRSIRVVTGAALATLSLSAAWQDFDQKATREEARYEQAAVAQLERERESVVATIEDAVPGQKDESEAERLARLVAASAARALPRGGARAHRGRLRRERASITASGSSASSAWLGRR
jgi:hypothetical protein